MSQHPPDIVISRFAAGTALTVAAGNASKALDSFSVWMLAGVGAALSLFISNANTLIEFTARGVLSASAKDFLIAAVLCIIQRYLHTIVTSGSKSATELLAISDKLQNLNLDEFSLQMKSAYPRILRPLISGAFDALRNGDLAYSGRFLIRLALLQGIFFTVQMFYIVSAISTIASKIGT